MIEATIARDSEGFPSLVTLQDGAKRLEVSFDRDSGFTISGSRRSFTTELLDVLRMIYPANKEVKFSIPQPLEVQTVTGGTVLLSDDMEALLKWREVGATVALDNTYAYDGSQSLQLTGALGGVATATRTFPVGKTGKYKVSFLWSVDDFTKLTSLNSIITIYDSRNFMGGGIQLTGAFMLQYLQAAAWVNLQQLDDFLAVAGVGGPWYLAEYNFSILNSNVYDKIRVGQHVIDVHNDEAYGGAAAGTPQQYAEIQLEIDAVAGQDVNVWFDNVMVREVI